MKRRGEALFFALLFCHVSATMSADSCGAGIRAQSPETTLRNGLLCNYEKERHPQEEMGKPVSVAPKIIFKSIEYYASGNQNNLVINILMEWKWTDQNLTWDPNTHHGVKSLWIDPESIWTPEALVMGTFEVIEMGLGRCWVTFDGQVSCDSPTAITTPCKSDITNWPFDIHTCDLKLMTGTIFTTIFNIAADALTFSMLDYQPNKAWDILVTDIKLDKSGPRRNKMLTLTYELQLRRRSAVHAATILLPALVLPVLTVSSFWIDPESQIRMYVCCMNIFTHVFYHQAMGYAIRSNGTKCPRITMYYRDSMVVAGITLVLTVVMQWLCSLSSTPPAWCHHVITWLLDKNALRTVLLISPEEQKSVTSSNEDALTRVNMRAGAGETKSSFSWKFVAHVADRILFHLFFLLCSILILIRVL